MIALFDRYAACLFLVAALSLAGTLALLADWGLAIAARLHESRKAKEWLK